MSDTIDIWRLVTMSWHRVYRVWHHHQRPPPPTWVRVYFEISDLSKKFQKSEVKMTNLVPIQLSILQSDSNKFKFARQIRTFVRWRNQKEVMKLTPFINNFRILLEYLKTADVINPIKLKLSRRTIVHMLNPRNKFQSFGDSKRNDKKLNNIPQRYLHSHDALHKWPSCKRFRS